MGLPPPTPSYHSACQTGNTAWRPVHAIAFLVLMAVTASVPPLQVWPWFWLAPLTAYGALVAVVPPLRATFQAWRFGRVSTSSLVATLIITTGSCAVLVAFHRMAHPDVSGYGRLLPVSALGGVLVAGLLFAVGNALLEEIVFRGILFDAAESQWGVWGAVMVTAAIFGIGHLHGYPPGPWGAVLAGIYGLCLGWLRVFSGGLGWPVLAHIAADAMIFTILAQSGAF